MKMPLTLMLPALMAVGLGGCEPADDPMALPPPPRVNVLDSQEENRLTEELRLVERSLSAIDAMESEIRQAPRATNSVTADLEMRRREQLRDSLLRIADREPEEGRHSARHRLRILALSWYSQAIHVPLQARSEDWRMMTEAVLFDLGRIRADAEGRRDDLRERIAARRQSSEP